jgi:hypothetical protein
MRVDSVREVGNSAADLGEDRPAARREPGWGWAGETGYAKVLVQSILRELIPPISGNLVSVGMDNIVHRTASPTQ